MADPFLEKVNLSDLGELDKSLINYLIKRYFMTWSFRERMVGMGKVFNW